jgi:hypothetical protein
MPESRRSQQQYADAWEDLRGRLVRAHAWLQAQAASTGDPENEQRLTAKTQVVADAVDCIGDLDRIVTRDGDVAWAWHEFVRAMVEGYVTETAAAESGRSFVLDYTRGYGPELAAGAGAYFVDRMRKEKYAA